MFYYWCSIRGFDFQLIYHLLFVALGDCLIILGYSNRSQEDKIAIEKNFLSGAIPTCGRGQTAERDEKLTRTDSVLQNMQIKEVSIKFIYLKVRMF